MFSDLMDSAKQTLDHIDLDSVKHLAEDTWLKTEHIAGEGIDSIRNVINSLDKKTMEEIVAKTWIHLKDMPNSAHDLWDNMDKSEKVAVAALMAGGAVVSVPFLIAAGPLSIVSALALLGGGTITAGGFGVAGGIIVTAAGATLSAALGGYVANKTIEDPDVAKLISAYAELETVIKQNFTIMEKHQAMKKTCSCSICWGAS